jgi:hypothetical protein
MTTGRGTAGVVVGVGLGLGFAAVVLAGPQAKPLPPMPKGVTWKPSPGLRQTVGRVEGDQNTDIVVTGTRYAATRDLKTGKAETEDPAHVYSKLLAAEGWVTGELKVAEVRIAPTSTDGPDGGVWVLWYRRDGFLRAALFSFSKVIPCNADRLEKAEMAVCQKAHPTNFENLTIFVSDPIEEGLLKACFEVGHARCP